MFLAESPYIEFTSNPYTDELKENWEIYRNEYWMSSTIEGHRMNDHWIINPIASKPNGDTSAHFPGMLYEGNVTSTCLMIRDCVLDDREKTTLNWGKNEKIRWWPNRMDRMPTLGYYTYRYSSILASVTFNTMMPDSTLNFHWGLDSNYIRIHVCLDSADGCVFNIEGWEHQWTDGDVFGFDDANVLHGTKHTGTKPRSIMLVDIHKDAIRPYCKIWPCRDKRPERKDWGAIKDSCSIIKKRFISS